MCLSQTAFYPVLGAGVDTSAVPRPCVGTLVCHSAMPLFQPHQLSPLKPRLSALFFNTGVSFLASRCLEQIGMGAQDRFNFSSVHIENPSSPDDALTEIY